MLFGKKVSEILVEKGKAYGVIFEDSYDATIPETKITAHNVIANAAIPLVKKLLPDTESAKIAHKTDHLKIACSLLSIYIGFNKEVKDLGNLHYFTFVLGDGVVSMKDIYENSKGDWKNKNFVFVDYSLIDS